MLKRQRTVLWSVVIIGLMCAVWLRISELGALASRDYDEGVYWLTLRAMDTGLVLYRDIFYSQPPAFLEFVHPIYAGLGHSIWSARLSIAIFSSLGFVGLGIAGYFYAGVRGVAVATAFLTADAWYLQSSRDLQADGPSIAFAALAVGLAVAAAVRRENARPHVLLAVAAGLSLAIAVTVKMLALPAVVPVTLLTLIAGGRRIDVRTFFATAAAFGTACVAILAPFAATWTPFVNQVVLFHTAASHANFGAIAGPGNLALVWSRLFSPLGLGAVVGLIGALLRRDSRITVALAWLAATILTMLGLVPLLTHHLVALDAPLILLAVFAVAPVENQSSRTWDRWNAACVGAVCVSAIFLAFGIADYAKGQQEIVSRSLQLAVAADVARLTPRAERVITDDQFIAGLADRDTPPQLVDTSFVRIASGYLSAADLVRAASDRCTGAVLFFTGRLMRPQVAEFRQYVTREYHLVKAYGPTQQLWLRSPAPRSKGEESATTCSSTAWPQ